MQKTLDALKWYRGFSEDLNQTGKRIDYQRCGNAKEFLSLAFKNYLIIQGKSLQGIPDNNPEMNETRETNIRTAMNVMRSMVTMLDCSWIYGMKLQKQHVI